MNSESAKALVQAQFGPAAAEYATSAVHAKGASLARLVELVQPQSDWRVLDVASAAGHTAFVFAPHVAHVISSDLTPEMLPVAARVAAEKGITNVSFEEADAEALPYDDGHFDLVTCRIAPHHFPDIGQFVREASRVLRSGGLLAVVDNVVLAGETGDYVNAVEKLRDPSHVRALDMAEWVALFEAAGFEIVEQETAPKKMAFESWAIRLGASPETVAELRTLFLDAPAGAKAFFQSEQTGTDIVFYLTEGLLVGRKSG